MNKLLVIFLLMSCGGAFSQSKMKLDDNIELVATIIEFNKEEHSIDTCEFQDVVYICTIDNSPWFGSDMGVEIPKYELKNLVIKYKGNSIELDVSGMFNPTYSGSINESHFTVHNYGNYIELEAWFADGAGTYCARWLITEDVQIRTLLSKNEGECFN